MTASVSVTTPRARASTSTATDPSRAPRRGDALAGFGRLVRFLVRRDRVRASIWFGATVGIFTVSVASVVGLYETPTELRSYADLVLADPAIKAFAGPGNGLDDPTQGAVVMNETMLYSYVAIALMCIFLVVRHTRAEEETDRAELVRAAPVGRYATLTAAVFWVATIDLAVAVGLVGGLLAFGLPLGGTVAFGAAAGGIGLVFVGVAALTAQTASSARAATAGASTVLGGAFLLRAVGDLGTGWLTWLSPLGWAQSISAFAGERWWVLALLYATAVGLIGTAVAMSGRRDLGAGLWQPRPGPERADRHLASPLALAARLARTSVIGWAVGVGILAFFMGIIANQADKFLEDETMAEFFALAGVGSPAELFLATAILMNAVIVVGFTVSSVLRLRSEELDGRAEPVLATPVSRQRWMLGQLAVASAGTITVVLWSGLLLGLGYAFRVGDWGEVLPALLGAAAMVPPLLVLAGFTVALIGVSPRWSIVAWVGMAYAWVVAFLAETLNLPNWVRNVSPFHHVPAIPAQSFDALPLVLLLAVAAALTLVGVVGITRRDLA